MQRVISKSLRPTIKKIMRWPKPYEFIIAPAIEQQTMRFRFADKSIVIESGADTPLYETIAEIVELRRLPAARYPVLTVEVTGHRRHRCAHRRKWIALRTVSGKPRAVCEPITYNCEQLSKNVRTNGATNIEIVQTAIEPSNGEMKFWAPKRKSVVGQLKERRCGR